ncbi:hypothetical protein BH23ACT10_BH23ACT10_08580 [soil metagenome]
MRSADGTTVTTVADVMTRRVTSITPATSVVSARRLLHSHGFRHLPVVEDGALIGIVSDRDVLPGVHDQATPDHRRPVRAVMSSPVRSARPDDNLLYAVRQMLHWKIDALPVLDRGRLVGVLTTTDCLDALHHLIAPASTSPSADPP